MDRKIVFAAVAAVVIALVGGGALLLMSQGGNKNTTTTMQSSTQESSTYKQFAAYKGAEYDRMFLASMIAHHQGAVDMAQLAIQQARHAELKAMAQDIITAQTAEIAQLQTWQKEWGHPSSSGEHMADHSAMGMMDDMDGMTEQLKNASGDDFDKKFLDLMIMHHQSAIDMSKPAATNAQHDQVKALAQNIITAQTKEIDHMRAWQKAW